MKLKSRNTNLMQGFTIIELMFATVVFSMVLIILTYGVISLSRTYYKGLTTNQTQNAARNIINTLTQAIEFDGSYSALAPNGQSYGFCIGTQRFSYLPGFELTGTYTNTNPPSPSVHTTQYSLIEDSAGCSLGTQDLTGLTGPVTGNELLGNNMRLANLQITPLSSTGLYSIDVRVISGADDLLSNPTGTNANCILQSGSQFCAASELQTTVARRIE